MLIYVMEEPASNELYLNIISLKRLKSSGTVEIRKLSLIAEEQWRMQGQ